MTPITRNELKTFANEARDEYINALVHGWDLIQKAGINTPARLTEFLAQTAHETGGYRIIREHTTWTPEQLCKLWPNRFKTRLDPRIIAAKGDPQKLANLVYSGRTELGNTGENDGWLYRGGGFLQTTGRYNYRRVGIEIGSPLEENPHFIDNCEISLQAALYEWTKRDCNRYADRGYTRAIGNAINRGNAFSKHEPIGHADRLRWKQRAVAVFGAGLVYEDGQALGAFGADIEALQRRLQELGYGTGAVDGIFGPTLARAVAAFKFDCKSSGIDDLEPAEVVGVKTWAALKSASPINYGERAQATEKDLLEAGSTEARVGKEAEVAGKVSVGVGGLAVANETGAIDTVKESVGWVPEMAQFMKPVIEGLQFGIKNAIYIVPVIGGIWFWVKGRKIISARLAAHRSGFNLFR